MLRFYDLLQEMDAFRRELEGADYWRRPFSRTSFVPAIGARHYPMINLYGNKDNLYLEALAPGLDIDKLDLSITDDVLTIKGEKPAADEKVTPEEYHRSERGAGKFTRTIELNTPVDPDKVKAEYKNGLLLITLPKAEKAKPRQIAITAG